jgi:hypothetical protein
MKPLFTAAALFFALPLPAHAAGYALHGTYLDYGTPNERFPAARRVPAVLYVSIRGREARLRLSAPGASCVPDFGDSHYVGPANGAGAQAVAVHVDQKGDCLHASDDARLLLRFQASRPRGVTQAVLTDHLHGEDGPVLFEVN